jgi:acetyl-CoA carboxylase carboxyl transferase subunit beta
MAWFRRKPEETAGTPKKVNIAEGLWIKCDSCKEIIYRAEVERAGRVCPKCRYPFRVDARERIALLADRGTFEEREGTLTSADPLGFRDTKKYRDRLRAARQKTSLEEAVVCGLARLGGFPVMLCAFEFAFLGGSMGSVVGEKLTRAIERACRRASCRSCRWRRRRPRSRASAPPACRTSRSSPIRPRAASPRASRCSATSTWRSRAR